jgi:Lon protease-like protein
MSASAIELPLFPLNVVLFPGVVLPLHIFEPRYRQMIIDCQAEQRPFGIVLAQPDSSPLQEIPHSVGTMVEIRDLQRLEDGRFVLMAMGLERFRILSHHRQKPYLSGLVEVYLDVPTSGSELDMYFRFALELFSTYLELL